jgi:hypothetical protein
MRFDLGVAIMKHGPMRAAALSALVVAGLALAQSPPAANRPATAPVTPPVTRPTTRVNFTPPLLDRIPPDAIAYFGWTGVAAPGSGFKDSPLQKILTETKLLDRLAEAARPRPPQPATRRPTPAATRPTTSATRPTTNATQPATQPAAEQLDQTVVAALATLAELGQLAWDRPGAFYVRIGDKGPEVVAMIDAGDKAEALATKVAAELNKALAGPNQPPSTSPPAASGARRPRGQPAVQSPADAVLQFMSRDGNLLIISNGATPPRLSAPARRSGGTNQRTPANQPPAAAPSLRDNPRFADWLGRQSSAPAAFAWFEAGPLVSMGLAQTTFADRASQSGLSDIEYVGLSGAFISGQWRSRAFVSVPAPRKGLALLLPEKRISQTLLERIPADTPYFDVIRFDARTALLGFKEAWGDDAKEGATSVFVKRGEFIETPNLVELAIGLASNDLGTPLRNGILRSLGPDWVGFVPTLGSGSASGIVYINRPNDAEQVRTNMVGAARELDRLTLDSKDNRYEYSAVNRPGLNIAILTHKGGTGKLVWTVRDGFFILGDDVEVVARAAISPTTANSLGKSPEYASILQSLGAPDHAAPGRIDLAALWPTVHARLLALAFAADLVSPANAPRLAPLIPDRDIVARHLTPVISAGWSDDAGYHFVWSGPFPAADALAFAVQSPLQSWSPLASEFLKRSQFAIEENRKKRAGGGG